jgi:hypothetical protein
MASLRIDADAITDHLARLIAEDVKAMMMLPEDAALADPTPYARAVRDIARAELAELMAGAHADNT